MHEAGFPAVVADDFPHAPATLREKWEETAEILGDTQRANETHSGRTLSDGLPTRADSVGDFLPVYTGPANGDLDVTAFEVVLVGTHAAPIGTTPGTAYV